MGECSRRGGGLTDNQYHGMVPDDKKVSSTANSFQAPVSPKRHWWCQDLVECGGVLGTTESRMGGRLLRTHTALSSRLHCTFSTSALPYTAQPCSYQAPILSASLPPAHVSTPPSGSSKYFPSLLFEASMGHGTSCTNHAGLPWGGRSERTGVSQTHRNPICTVFIRCYFSCQDSHHQSAAGSKQPVKGAIAVDVMTADLNNIPQLQPGGRDRE